MEQLINDLQELYDDLLCGDEYYEDIFSTAKLVRQAAEELSRYQTAEQKGRMVVLPCKPETEVYRIWSTFNGKYIKKHWIGGFRIDTDGDLSFKLDAIKEWFYCDDIGKTIFFTPEEAEAALAEQRKDENNL